MTRRSYLVSLLKILLELCAYIGRNRNRIQNRNPTLDMTLVDSVLDACELLSDAIEDIEGHGT